MNPALALQMLRGQTTLEFLKTTVVTIGGASSAGAADFYISAPLKSKNDRREKCDIKAKSGAPGEVKFRAFNVPMQNRDGISSAANINGVQLPMDGPDLMVTGMLTACSFGFTTDKKNVYCCHIQPRTSVNAANKGLALGVELVNGGKFGNSADAMTVFSHREYSECTSATVLGVRRLDGWSLYCQGILGMTMDVKFAVQIL
ncbi:hypothetical protein [Rhodospirillaceae bacterium SYSU D60014]|uniref:hypothetical protein n=1 Tax=Virgifigura deserti TaxID=2268457 RepID=UPI000E671AD1